MSVEQPNPCCLPTVVFGYPVLVSDLTPKLADQAITFGILGQCTWEGEWLTPAMRIAELHKLMSDEQLKSFLAGEEVSMILYGERVTLQLEES